MADKLKDSLPRVSSGSLLNVLNVFIQTHIRNVPKEEAEGRYKREILLPFCTAAYLCYIAIMNYYRLVTMLAMVYEDMGDLEQRGFPGEIQLCHVVSVWEHMIEYDQKLQKTIK